MYGFPAGQPSYSNCIPHHPYCVYSAQNPHLSAEESSSGTARAPKSSQVVLGQAESFQASPQTPFGQLAAQAPQTTIPAPIQAYRSENGTQNRTSLVSGSSTESEDAQCPRKSSKSQQNTQHRGSVSAESSVTIEKIRKSRQATNPGKQAVLGSKRSRERSQGFDQGSINEVSDSTHQPIKITRQENASQSYKNRRPASSTAYVLKRSRQDIEDNDEDGTGSLPAKKSRHKYSPKTRIVKMSVSSYEGMQRLRQIFTTSQADSQSGSTIQDNFQTLTSGSESRSSFSSQPIKKPRLDGVLDAAGYQPVPWPVPDLPPQIPHKQRSCQLPTKPGRAGHQGSYSGLLSQHTRTTNQVNDDEAREAATILLNMRLGR
ncbi:hypothetical protein N0V93_003398 [Gnomoniopsis smithogilvyi]|uniref:Uncharacterized protein n=1 Tax=Gnomoniopsis smithogilvyi TaxID=1191159 RepID=A0A9W9CZ38_9PEZI|nr:hypothetical protein N0V93_003398 [Gnomoniopsis smithogilvyi]